MSYMIEFHLVPHEIAMYVEEIKLYGDVTHYSERFPTHIWIESDWEKDIIELSMGVKKVYPKRFFNQVPLSPEYGRNWTELLGTKWEVNPE